MTCQRNRRPTSTASSVWGDSDLNFLTFLGYFITPQHFWTVLHILRAGIQTCPSLPTVGCRPRQPWEKCRRIWESLLPSASLLYSWYVMSFLPVNKGFSAGFSSFHEMYGTYVWCLVRQIQMPPHRVLGSSWTRKAWGRAEIVQQSRSSHMRWSHRNSLVQFPVLHIFSNEILKLWFYVSKPAAVSVVPKGNCKQESLSIF